MSQWLCPARFHPISARGATLSRPWHALGAVLHWQSNTGARLAQLTGLAALVWQCRCLLGPSDPFCGTGAPGGPFATALVQRKGTAGTTH